MCEVSLSSLIRERSRVELLKSGQEGQYRDVSRVSPSQGPHPRDLSAKLLLALSGQGCALGFCEVLGFLVGQYFSIFKNSYFHKEIYYDRNTIYYDMHVPMQIPEDF